jgi:hypothetical protein
MPSTYLSRTPASSTNRQTFTLSTWVKRSASLGSYQQLFGTDPSNIDVIGFDNNNKFRIYIYNNPTSTIRISTQVFRDVSAWYHVVVAFDTPNATAQNRCRVYINGTDITTWDTNYTVTQNLNTNFNHNVIQYIGRYATGEYFDGLMANIYMIDGQQLTPSSFGETDATTGIWKPKAYTGSYGTNGFFLKFENSGSLGTDSSGNGNNFTVNGTPTQTVDTPSNVFATLNPLNYTSSAITYSNGNTKASFPGAWIANQGTIGGMSGKYFWEAKVNSGNSVNLMYGICRPNVNLDSSPYSQTGVICQHINGDRYVDGTYTSSAAQALVNGDILGVALDLNSATKTVKFYKNGTLLSSGSSINLTSTYDNEFVLPFFIGNNSSASSIWETNFGNGYFATTAISSPYSDGAGLGKFQYQPPTGYYALCTKNINVYG